MIKRLCMVTLIVGMLLATVLFDSSAFEHFIKWTVFARVSLGLTLITICVIIPVMVTTSISNNHLKFLTIKFTEQMKNQARHYKALAESNYKIRKFKHDFKNLSFALKKYLAEGRCEEAIKILEEYNKNMASSENIRFDTGNGIADALLEDKAMLAESFGGNIVFKGALPIDKIEPTDICIILGNSLDNAIEAIEKITDNREKIISVSSDIGNGYMFLKIENPVNEKVDISGNHITTTKEDKSLHGFGIFSLKEAIKKYNGKLSFASTNDKFTASIDLSLQ
ncbi:MAG: GHKL domain-containing protein [Oscillospiraceae bacterium]|nr:GHKL domain-containing protein [Oscillospiraceae bacterium]